MRSLQLAERRMMSGGAIPDRLYRSSVGVGFRQPVMRRQVEFMTGSSFLACADLSQTGQAYSAVDMHRARAVDRIVLGEAPHCVLLSLRMMLFLVHTFALVFSTCLLKVRLLSRVTPR